MGGAHTVAHVSWLKCVCGTQAFVNVEISSQLGSQCRLLHISHGPHSHCSLSGGQCQVSPVDKAGSRLFLNRAYPMPMVFAGCS